MSVNKFLPHVLVLPEDGANRQLANGFQLEQTLASRRMQILGEAGGWREAAEQLTSDHLPQLEKYPRRFMVLLIDFDGDPERAAKIKADLPPLLKERIFVLGARTEPEELRRALGSYETVGLKMAMDCRENTDLIWGHELLRHNEPELEQLRRSVRPFLFPSP